METEKRLIKVVRVIDGDTVEGCYTDGPAKYKFRLNGIESCEIYDGDRAREQEKRYGYSAEKRHLLGSHAKETTEKELVLNEWTPIKHCGLGAYGRFLIDIYPIKGGICSTESLNTKLLEEYPDLYFKYEV